MTDLVHLQGDTKTHPKQPTVAQTDEGWCGQSLIERLNEVNGE